MSGFTDLHCHLLWGLDDGARSEADSLEMGRVLVDLGFSTVAPSPHHRPEFAPRELALQRMAELQAAYDREGVGLSLHENAENYMLDEAFLTGVVGPSGRRVAGRGYALVEAPYSAPVPALLDIIFRLKLKGITLLIAHPERCFEFEKKGRAQEAVNAGAYLQLDLGSLVGKYGPAARKLARGMLEEDLYTVAASDLHSAAGARDWLQRSIDELRALMGPRALTTLLADNPAKILQGAPI